MVSTRHQTNQDKLPSNFKKESKISKKQSQKRGKNLKKANPNACARIFAMWHAVPLINEIAKKELPSVKSHLIPVKGIDSEIDGPTHHTEVIFAESDVPYKIRRKPGEEIWTLDRLTSATSEPIKNGKRFLFLVSDTKTLDITVKLIRPLPKIDDLYKTEWLKYCSCKMPDELNEIPCSFALCPEHGRERGDCEDCLKKK